jgi:stearoyl-CoA desaturase (Delta-9 desaturase)
LKQIAHCRDVTRDTLGVERIAIEKAGNNRGVTEIAQQRTVRRKQQEGRLHRSKRAGIHLSLQKGGRSSEHWFQDAGKVDTKVCSPIDRFAPKHTDHVGVIDEEVRADIQYRVEERPAVIPDMRDRFLKPNQPIRQAALEDFAIERLLRCEVVQQAWSAYANLGRDVVQAGGRVAVFGEAALRGQQDRLPSRRLLNGHVHHPSLAYLLVGRPACYRSSLMGSLLRAILIGLAVTQVANLITTIYLHRALTHKALTYRPGISFVFRAVLWVSTGMKAREWVAVHRKHHAHTDTAQDPHTPVVYGWYKVLLTNAALYRRAARSPENVQKYAKDLPPDAWDRVLFDRAIVGLGLGITALILLLGPWAGLVASVVHAVCYLAIGGAVNGIGHHFGKRPHDNSATNQQWLAWLSAGEGLHNNHHAAPTSARLALRAGEIDPGWWFISLARWLGQATIRLDHAKLK